MDIFLEITFPLISIWLCHLVRDTNRRLAREARERRAQESTYKVVVADYEKTMHKLVMVEKQCTLLSEQVRVAGLDKKRKCPGCDVDYLEADFEPNDYICRDCRTVDLFGDGKLPSAY